MGLGVTLARVAQAGAAACAESLLLLRANSHLPGMGPGGGRPTEINKNKDNR